MGKAYTLNELMIITIAKEIQDHENVVLGIGIPMISGALAKALYAPNATLIMESGMVDFQPILPMMNVADCMAVRGFSYSTDLFSTFTSTYRGFVDVCFLGVGQVDRFGNLNSTVIGDYNKPETRLPGSGGAADFISYARRTILTMRAGEFVEQLPYITSPGYLEGGSEREASGHFLPGSGPKKLISPQGIFEFDPRTKEMFLSGLLPGATVADIRKKVPWDLKVASNLQKITPPEDHEIDFIRQKFPTESISKKLLREMAMNNFMEQMANRSSRQSASQ